MPFLGKPVKVRSELVSDPPEFGKPLLFGALYGRRVLKAPVKALGRGRKHRTTFFGMVTHGDHIIEILPGKFLN